MKRFTIPCDFDGTRSPFHIYVGTPLAGSHPLKYQAAFLREFRGGTIPSEVMDGFQQLMELAEANHLPFEELCVYTLTSANAASEATSDTGAAAEGPADSDPQGPPADHQPR